MKWIGVPVIAGLIALPALAKDKAGGPRPKAFQELVDCRAIPDSSARLACYDRAVTSLDAAEKAKDVVIVDREQIKEVRRSVFGLTLPRLKLFSADGGDEVDRIETTIVSAQTNGAGQLSLKLADGAVWMQTDDFMVAGTIRPGTKVTIKHGFATSFFATIQGRPGFRVRRVN